VGATCHRCGGGAPGFRCRMARHAQRAQESKLPQRDLGARRVATPKSAKDTAYRVHFRQHGPFAARSRFTGFPPFVDNFDFSDVERFFVGTKNS